MLKRTIIVTIKTDDWNTLKNVKEDLLTYFENTANSHLNCEIEIDMIDLSMRIHTPV